MEKKHEHDLFFFSVQQKNPLKREEKQKQMGSWGATAN